MNTRLKVFAAASFAAIACVALAAQERISIAVMPFKSLPAGDHEYGYPTSESIHTFLSSIDSIRTVERMEIDRLIEEVKLETGNAAMFDPDTVVAQGRMLRVQFVVLGSVTKIANRVEIAVRVVSGATGTVRFAAIQKGEFESIFDLQEEIGKIIVAKLDAKLTEEQEAKLFPDGRDLFVMYSEPDSERRVELLEEAARLRPDYVPGLKLLADAYLKAGRMQDAARVMDHALAIDPSDEPLRTRYAILLIDRKMVPEARREFQRLTRDNPDKPDLWFNLGRLYEYNDAMQHMGKGSSLADAERCYRKALEVGGDHPEAMFSLAVLVIFRAQGQSDLKRQVDLVTEAVGLLKGYLAARPEAENADSVRREIASYEAYLESASKYTPKKK